MKIIQHPSPNYDARMREVDSIILHYTGMKTGTEALERLCDHDSHVSAHYLVEENGDVFQMVDEEHRAWHAGVSYWNGVDNLNHNSIGIEIVNPGHEHGYKPFTQEQYDSIIELCSNAKKKHGIADINIIGHSDIAPDRKEDPGELFNWEMLSHHNIGLWVNLDDETRADESLRLTDLGYKEHNEKSILAFQRHWQPWKLDGVMDEQSQNILSALIKLI